MFFKLDTGPKELKGTEVQFSLSRSRAMVTVSSMYPFKYLLATKIAEASSLTQCGIVSCLRQSRNGALNAQLLAASLSCVLVSKSLLSWRSCN